MAERALHPDLDLRLWDAPELSDLLRERPRIVERFFGKDAARAFCLSGSHSPAASPDDVCPYPGMAPFEPGQARWFFGRTAVAVAGKMDALFNRWAPRDFLDVAAILASGRYSRDQLMALAAEHNPGFSPAAFAESLSYPREIPDFEFAAYGASAEQIAAMRRELTGWEDALQDAQGQCR